MGTENHSDFNAAFERMRADILAVCVDGSDGTGAARFLRLRGDVLAAWTEEVADGERQLAEAFEVTTFPRLVALAKAGVHDFEEQLGKLHGQDPALLKTDLLGVIGRERDEVAHTQALASLMSKAPFAAKLISALLAAADDPCNPDATAGARVLAEHSVTVGRKERRLDLLIQVGTRLLVVIENKVDAKDSDEQLDDYKAWSEGQQVEKRLLIYLTPGGDEPARAGPGHGWTAVSYMKLLIQWRHVLTEVEGSASEWVDVLRLYLATLARHVCRIHPSKGASLAERLRMIDYLRTASGG